MRRPWLILLFIAPTLTAQQYLLPAAGNHAGANGTFFRSDVTISNFREDNQRIGVRWLPQGRSAGTSDDAVVTVGAFSSNSWENFVGEVLTRSELGAILFTALHADGTPDTNARLTIQSRVWSPHPSGGTMSQSFAGIPLTAINSHSTFVITGQRADTRFRMNIGIVNLDPTTTHTFGVIPQPGVKTTEMTVPPMSMVMTALPEDPNIQNYAQIVRIHPRTLPDASKWIGFGSSVDNVTGDAWSSVGYGALLP